MDGKNFFWVPHQSPFLSSLHNTHTIHNSSQRAKNISLFFSLSTLEGNPTAATQPRSTTSLSILNGLWTDSNRFLLFYCSFFLIMKGGKSKGKADNKYVNVLLFFCCCESICKADNECVYLCFFFCCNSIRELIISAYICFCLFFIFIWCERRLIEGWSW